MGSLRRISNIRTLVAALRAGAMGPAAAAELLGVTYNAARNYMDVLVAGGAAMYHPDRRTHVCLHPDGAVVEGFLDSLAPQSAMQRATLMRFPVRRDPLVAALFGTTRPPDSRSSGTP